MKSKKNSAQHYVDKAFDFIKNLKYPEINALGLFLVNIVLLFALISQFVWSELPCPLCSLQRLGFVSVMFGLALNLLYGLRPSHYALTIIGAFFGALPALRQVALHVIPGTPHYGSAFLGFHFYTWAFILFMVIILGIAILSSDDSQYQITKKKEKVTKLADLNAFPRYAIYLTVIVVVLNLINVFAVCGPFQCPDDPVKYWLFN